MNTHTSAAPALGFASKFDTSKLADDRDAFTSTNSWVHWFNEERMHGHCNDAPPAEFEAAFYAAQQVAPTGVGHQ